MASSPSRFLVLIIISLVVIAGAAMLINKGVDFTGKQKRAAELAENIQVTQARMKDLYDRRTAMIAKWLDEQAEKQPIVDAKSEANDAAAVAEAQASGAPTPAPTVDPVQAQEDLKAVRVALDETRALALQNQTQFDQFDRLQNQISNYVAQKLLEQLRQEATAGKGSVTLDQIREFEQLEMEIANTRRDYHTAAFERNKLLEEINDLPFGLTRAPTPVPVFSTERTLYEQSAGR